MPAPALAHRAGLSRLTDEWLSVLGSAGTAGAKIATLVAGMLAGADSIDELGVLRHGGVAHLFGGVRGVAELGIVSDPGGCVLGRVWGCCPGVVDLWRGS